MERLVFFTNAFMSAPRGVLDRSPGRSHLRVRFGVWRDSRGGAWILDTGYATPDPQSPWDVRMYHKVLRHQPTGWTPARACAALGIRKADVRGVILSHLHRDHIEGLASDALKDVEVFVPKAAHDFWRKATVWQKRVQGHLADSVLDRVITNARPYEDRLPIFGLRPVALPGHAPGHTGLLVGHGQDTVLWAADASWTKAGLMPAQGPRWPMSRLGGDPVGRDLSRAEVFAQVQAGKTVVLCHDPDKHTLDWKDDVWVAKAKTPSSKTGIRP